MCKLIIVTKPQGYHEAVNSCVGAQYGTIYNEPHGFSALTLSEGKPSQFLALARAKYAGAYVDALTALERSTFAVLHSRFATTGSASETNLHTAEHDRGRYIAHNGMVSQFTGAKFSQGVLLPSYQPMPDASRGYSKNKAKKAMRKALHIINTCVVCQGISLPCERHFNEAMEYDALEQYVTIPTTAPASKPVNDTTDSYQFLQALPDILTKDNIANAMKTYGFTGVASIYDSVEGKAWLLATRTVYAHTDGEYAVMYSYKPDEPRMAYEVAGIPMLAEVPTKLAEVKAGVYEIAL